MGRVGGVRFAAARLHQPRPRPPRLPRRRRGLLPGEGAAVRRPRRGARWSTVDDEAGRRLAGLRPDAVTVSISGAGRLDGDRRRAGPRRRLHRSRCTAPDGATWPARVRLPGAFNVANAVLAVALLDAVGVPVDDGARRARRTPVVPGRMEPVDGRPAVRRRRRLRPHPGRRRRGARRAARRPPRGRLITVLGCGGDRDPGKRPADGGRRGRRQRCADRDRRQPAHRGPGRHPRGDAGRGGRRARRPPRRGARGRRPPRRDRRRGRAWPRPATRCWSPARATRPARRSPARCTRSTTGPCCARCWPRSGSDGMIR